MKNSSLASPFVGVSNNLGIHARQAIKDNNTLPFEVVQSKIDLGDQQKIAKVQGQLVL